MRLKSLKFIHIDKVSKTAVYTFRTIREVQSNNKSRHTHT